MRFVVLPREGTMTIDNQRYALPANSFNPIPANHVILTFSGDSGRGFIERDGAKLLDTEVDPAAYESLINAWMNVALPTWYGMSDGAAALNQARQVKTGYVDAIFHAKRQARISVAALAGLATWWNADDEEVDYITEQINQWDVAAAAQSAINGRTVTPGAATINNIGVQSVLTTPWASDTIQAGRYYITTAASLTSFNASASNSSTVSGIGLTGPGIAITPYGSTAAVSVSMINARTLIREISARRQRFNDVRVSRKNAFNTDVAITTIIARSAADNWGS